MPLSLVTIKDLLEGLNTFDDFVRRIAGFEGALPVSLLAAEEPDAELSLQEGRDALCRADVERGVSSLVAAIAHAPTWDEPRRVLQETIDVLTDGSQAPPATRGGVELVPVERVLAEPSLLTTWVAAHADGSTTLVITGVADDAAREAIVAVVDDLGLADDGRVDLLAVAEREPATVAVRLGRALDEPLAA